MAAHTEFCSKRRSLTGVVRLGGTLGHNKVGSLQLGLGHQEFELAGLVPPSRKTRAVVTFDPDFRSAKQF